jgi:hypothetical protein
VWVLGLVGGFEKEGRSLVEAGLAARRLAVGVLDPQGVQHQQLKARGGDVRVELNPSLARRSCMRTSGC